MRLSNGELELMNLLWEHGAMTLAAAHQAFGPEKLGYTTMQTRLNRLVEKGLATKSGRPALYSAAIGQEEIRAGHLDSILTQLSGGSVVPLVAQLVHDRKISSDELDALKELVSEAEQQLTSENESSVRPVGRSSKRGRS
ncbi:MAG: BlaI/MecI/CopY family transcriptional regulator [Planctomycetota bacterium]